MSQPAEGTLRNLNQPIGNNLGGLEALFFVPADQVVSIPGSSDVLVSTSVVLAGGATWYQLVAPIEQLRYLETPATDRHSNLWKVQLKGVAAKDTQGLAAGLAAMHNRRFVVLFRDANGNVKIVGSPAAPLKFTYGLDTGERRSNRNERAFAFSAELKVPSRFYQGAWAVSDLGLQYAQPSSGSGGLILVKDTLGNLLTSVASGRTLVLNTDFAFTYAVL